MKPQVTGAEMRPPATKPAGAEAALSLQDELVAAIHGAFEVAVEIAVREVTKLVGQATGGVYGEMRRENESLKQRLQRAEAMLNFARREDRGGSSPPSAKQLLDATKNRDRSPRFKYSQKSPDTEACIDHGGTRVRGQPAPTGSTHQPADHQEQTSGDAASDSEKNNGCAVACEALTTGVSEEMSHVCVVRVESLNQSCQDPAAQGHGSPPLPSAQDRPALEEVTVKQEKTEEEADGSACCLDSIKVEDFSHECMSEVQSKLLEEWKPEALDIQSQDPSTCLSCSGLEQEFPNILQLPEPASIPDAPSQVYGVHVRSGHGQTFTNLYACKSCGQTFHLPSLLRRHHGQCQQKLQQRCQPPVVGNRRTRLQLYPPGCSPFCCTVCNREFNRMENLKTHLRIHTGERPYTCSVCSKCFRHSGALTRHFRIHTGEKPYICGQCGKSFRNCGGLKFHQRSHSKQLQ